MPALNQERRQRLHQLANCAVFGDPNRFVLGDVLGIGTFAVTFRAYDKKRNRFCALKVEIASQDSQLQNEREIYRYLNGRRGVPKCYGRPQMENDFRYLSIELLGKSLRNVLSVCQMEYETLSTYSAILVAMELIEIAKSIHNGKGRNLGCAHRDIKLDNILLNESKSKLFLVDFGIAKPLYKDFYGAQTDMCQIATACIILLVGRCNYEGNRELIDKLHPLFFEFKRAMHALPDRDSPDYDFWMRKFKSSFYEEFDAEKNYFKTQAEEKFFAGFRPLTRSLLDEL
ncbi:protein kinase domain-containing protein [Ditylenchus destructor]|uniref:non-specific serine/threonine protein kinase n=1 Tax=Ditylenchus destructor TaxID=166010 RepID=A0AAD4N369_9BILA|nr:protein kinase domain-containing protein [Ditylenchus destructor]